MEAQVELERRTSLAISHEIIFSFDFEFVSSSSLRYTHSYSRESRGNREKNLAMGKERKKVRLRDLRWNFSYYVYWLNDVAGESGGDDGGFWASHKLYYFTLRHEKREQQQ